jgi:hypothetical protein
MRVFCPVKGCKRKIAKSHIVAHPSEVGAYLMRCPRGHTFKAVRDDRPADFYTGPMSVKGKQ